jgi:NAD(P)H-hydrate repair Nnr-like enzyme with NAD(P)H-hydrate epimerase domain
MSHLAKLLASSNNKFATLLNESKIDPIRLLAASHPIESLRHEDKQIKREKKAAAGKDDEAAKAARSKKPRTGRPVTERLVTDALAGKAVSGPAKTRLLRAFNAVRAQKKLAAVELKQLF